MSKPLLDRAYKLMDTAKEMGLTQRQIAEGAGVSYWWYIKFHQRSIQNPAYLKLQQVCDYLEQATQDRAA